VYRAGHGQQQDAELAVQSPDGRDRGRVLLDDPLPGASAASRLPRLLTVR